MLKSLLLALGLALATWLVFAETTGFGFVDYDDPPYVSANPIVQRGLTLEGARWVLTEAHGGNWHPLTGLSHMIDCELFGPDAGGHHAVNVGLHVLAVLLLFGLLASTTGSRPAAAAVAALFALHPLHVESVAWISERKDVLSTALGFACLWTYCAWTRRRGALRYGLTFALLALGLMAKSMLVTWPFVMLLLDVWPLERKDVPIGRRVVEKLPFLALALGAATLTFLFQRGVGAMSSTEIVPLAPRATNAVVAYGRYLLKAVWPPPMSVLYPHPAMPGGTPLATWQVGVAAGVLVALTALVFVSRRRYAIVGWLWYLGTLVPVLGLVQVGVQAIADRYTYVPLVGVFVAVVYAAREALGGLRPAPRIVTGSLVALLVLVPAGLLARAQVRVWRDTRTLFEHALAVAPRSTLVLTTLGSLCQERGDAIGARGYYKRSLEVQPDHAETNYNLAALLLAEGRAGEAMQRLDRAIEKQPSHVHARNMRGQVHLMQGDAEGALEEFEGALAVRPDDAISEMNAGNALMQLGRPEDAARRYRRAIELDPRTGGAHFNLANLLAGTAPDEALAHYRAAVEAEPSQPQFSFALARILARHPDPDVRDGTRAVLLAERVAAVAPNDPAVLDVLASAYAAKGQFPIAVGVAQKGLHFAGAGGLADLAAQLSARLELYQRGEPYLEAP